MGTHDGGIEKIVQLRNSWTHFQWNGDWSAKSPCWTDVARKQVKLSPDPNTDTFWMAFDEFIMYFTRFSICKFVPSYNFTSFKTLISPSGYHLIKMHVATSLSAGEQTISVSQIDEKCLTRDCGYQYKNCRIIVVRLRNSRNFNDGIEYINGSKTFQQRDAFVELGSVPSGTYYIIVEIEYDKQNIYSMQYGSEVCITNYGAGTTTFGGDDSGLVSLERILHYAFISKINQNPPRLKISDMSQRGAPDIIRYESVDAPEGFNFIYVDNKNRTHSYVEEMTYTVYDGVQLMLQNDQVARDALPPPRHPQGHLDVTSDHSYRLVVPPLGAFMILLRTAVAGFRTEATCSRNVVRGGV